MSELAEDFKFLKEMSKTKKATNLECSLKILEEHGVKYEKLSETHIRTEGYDYWPSTGLFINVKTKKRGRGVFVLLKKLGKT